MYKPIMDWELHYTLGIHSLIRFPLLDLICLAQAVFPNTLKRSKDSKLRLIILLLDRI